jgi:Glycosyl transferase family 2
MKKATLIYNKANTYGIQSDVQVLEKVLKGFVVKHADPLEPAQPCDLAVHVEVPFYGWMPWAARNVFLVNPEWWEAGWNSYLARCDALIFKCSADKDTFYGLYPEAAAVPFYILPWTSPVVQADFSKFPASTSADVGFLWLLGASKNKREAAKKVIPLWHMSWPPLTVYTTTELGLEGDLPTSVRIHVKDLDVAMRRQLQAFYPGHVIFSAAEAFCMAAHEGQAAGAFLLGNALPTYAQEFQGNSAVHLVPASLEPLNAGMRDSFAGLTASGLAAGIQAFLAADLVEVRKKQKALAITTAGFSAVMIGEAFAKIMSSVPASALAPLLPPLLAQGQPKLPSAESCPPISIVTLLHNRRRFVDLCLHNLLITDYPKDKIEWVVVEDSDIVEEQAADKVLKFGRGCAPMSVSYIPLEKKNVPIGSMRNKAIKMAQHDIILFMDDDDHYPPTSFSKRVAWLVAHPWQPKAVACTTIACYDLIRGTSAVNTPPWTLPLRQRISEATLTFYKSWWEEKKFPKVSMAEGEGFLEGRESDVLELPPQQMIVAMSHGKNTSGRRIPPSGQEPSCFWGFPKEFLVFLHKLAGVDVAEAEA